METTTRNEKRWYCKGCGKVMETEEKLQNISNEKKVKKVIKGLEKASKTHAKQAKILKSGLKV